MTLQETLDSLGNSDIVAKFREMKIRGSRQSFCNCPVANYLRACGFKTVSVGLSDAGTDEEGANMPSAVGQWIQDFDSGLYSEFEGGV